MLLHKSDDANSGLTFMLMFTLHSGWLYSSRLRHESRTHRARILSSERKLLFVSQMAGLVLQSPTFKIPLRVLLHARISRPSSSNRDHRHYVSPIDIIIAT